MPLSDQTRAMLGMGPARPASVAQAPRPRGLSPQTRAMLGLPEPAQSPPEEPGFFERWAPLGARLAGPIAGGIAGAKIGAGLGTAVAPGPGSLIGGVIGAGIGGIAGEIGAEKLEGRELDPAEIALAGGLSAIPAGPFGRAAVGLARGGAANLGKRALLHVAEGASQGVLGEAVRPAVMEGRLPTGEELTRGALAGGALGGVMGTGIDLALSPRGGRSAIDDHVARLEAEEAVRARIGPQPPFPEAVRPVDTAPVVPEPPPFELPYRADVPPLVPEAPPFVARGMAEPAIVPEPPPFPVATRAPRVMPEAPPFELPLRTDPPLTPEPPPFELGPARLQAEADAALLARVEAEQAQPVSARIPEWEGEVADASRMAREAAREQTAVPVEPRTAERRQAVEPTSAERRIADRRAQVRKQIAAEENLPEDSRAVARILDAEIDPKTGLWSRPAFERDIEAHQGGIGTDDLGGLKWVNDNLGHDAGDRMIESKGIAMLDAADEINSKYPDANVRAYRPKGGGDEGSFLASRPEYVAEAYTLAKENFNRRVFVIDLADGKRVRYTGGVLDYGISGGGGRAGLRRADAALYAGRAEAEARGERVRGAKPQTLRPIEEAGAGEGSVPSLVPEPGVRPVSPELAPGGETGVGRVAPPAEPLRAIAPAEQGVPEPTAPAPLEAPPKPPQSIPPTGERRMFDRDAARARLMERSERLGRQANSLGSAAAEGPGVLRDAAEIGASYIEDFARRNAGKVPEFDSWARTVGRTLVGVVENVGKFLRQIYDEAVNLFRGRAPQDAAAPVMPPAVEPGKPVPPVGPKPVPQPAGPPSKPPSTPPPSEPLGAPKPPGEPPRVETKVEQLREAAPDVKLSRDAPRTWESLDDPIRAKLNDVLSDEAKEASFYERARSGKLNDVDVQTLDALVTAKREKYDSARQAMLKAENDPQANAEYLRAAMDQATADLVVAARSDVEAGTKLARALAARARVMKAAAVGDSPDAMLRVIMREIPDVTNAQATDLLRVYRERPQDMADAIRAALQPKTLNKWLEAWKAGLVSAPGTQVANILGNLAEQVLRVGETATSAAIDPFFGGARARISGEARYELSGAMRGASKSLGRLATDLRDILTLAPERIDITGGNYERQTGAIGGATGRAVRIPFRLLQAFDVFSRGIGGEAELHKLAWRRANGNRMEAQRIIGDPPDDLIQMVRRSEQERTFQNPNRLADSITKLRSDHKWLHVVMPFVQTPANIASLTIQRSPAGFVDAAKAYGAWRKAIAAGADAAEVLKLKGEAIDKMSRPLVGTMILGTFAAVAKAGGMTGSGPTDAKERNELRNGGWQPYSFKVGDTYIPYNRFEPVSSLFGFAADMIEAKDQKTAGDLADKALGSIIQNLTSKTYLRGLADAAAAINDPKQFAGQYVSSLAGSVVPNVVTKAAQAIDPALRDVRPETSGLGSIPERITKTVASRLPGVSMALEQRRGGTGEPIERPGNAITRFLSPVQPSTEDEGSEFSKLLVDIEAVPSAPRRDIKVKGREVRLTSEEYASLQAADEKTTKELRKLATAPGFKRAEPERQRQIIENAYNRGRADARNRILRSTAFRGRLRAAPKEAR